MFVILSRVEGLSGVEGFSKDEPALRKELAPFLRVAPPGRMLRAYLETVDQSEMRTIDFLVKINQSLWKEISYVIRMEHGIQPCDQTLTLGTGSCRDSATKSSHAPDG